MPTMAQKHNPLTSQPGIPPKENALFPSSPTQTITPQPPPPFSFPTKKKKPPQRQTKQKSLSHLNPPSPHLLLVPPGVSTTSSPFPLDHPANGLDTTPPLAPSLSRIIKLVDLDPLPTVANRLNPPLSLRDTGVRKLRTDAPVWEIEVRVRGVLWTERGRCRGKVEGEGASSSASVSVLVLLSSRRERMELEPGVLRRVVVGVLEEGV